MPVLLLAAGAAVALGIIGKGAADAERTVAQGVSKNTAFAIGLAGAALIVYAYQRGKA